MSQRANYYEEELDDADDLADVGLNLAIGNYGQGGLFEDGSEQFFLRALEALMYAHHTLS
jgi:hypothetical protein